MFGNLLALIKVIYIETPIYITDIIGTIMDEINPTLFAPFEIINKKTNDNKIPIT